MEHELVLFMVEPDAIKTAMGGKGAEVRLSVCVSVQNCPRFITGCISYAATVL